MNSKLRSLIQQLGEAIHETVADSEDIAGVVRNIRAEGFDVLLMLEATIGLNEVDAPGTEPNTGPASALGAASGASEDASNAPKGPFTPQDVHFLQSLRIRMDSDPDDTDPDGLHASGNEADK